jgi:hypothetical protein
MISLTLAIPRNVFEPRRPSILAALYSWIIRRRQSELRASFRAARNCERQFVS